MISFSHINILKVFLRIAIFILSLIIYFILSVDHTGAVTSVDEDLCPSTISNCDDVLEFDVQAVNGVGGAGKNYCYDGSGGIDSTYDGINLGFDASIRSGRPINDFVGCIGDDEWNYATTNNDDILLYNNVEREPVRVCCPQGHSPKGERALGGRLNVVCCPDGADYLRGDSDKFILEENGQAIVGRDQTFDGFSRADCPLEDVSIRNRPNPNGVCIYPDATVVAAVADYSVIPQRLLFGENCPFELFDSSRHCVDPSSITVEPSDTDSINSAEINNCREIIDVDNPDIGQALNRLLGIYRDFGGNLTSSQITEILGNDEVIEASLAACSQCKLYTNSLNLEFLSQEDKADVVSCMDCTFQGINNTWTGVGCVRATSDGIVTRTFQIALGISGLIIIIRLGQIFLIAIDQDPGRDKVTEMRDIAVSLGSFAVLLGGAYLILRFIFNNILGIQVPIFG